MTNPDFDRDKAQKDAAQLGEILAGHWGRNVETGWTYLGTDKGRALLFNAYTTPTTLLGLNAALRLFIDPNKGLPIDQSTVRDRGTARKIEYLAGGKEIREIESSYTGAVLSGATHYWVYYSGPIEAILTPKKLPKIIERVTLALHKQAPSLPASPQPDLGLIYADWPPMKAMGIAAISDHEASITTWARKKNAGASSDRNPVLTGSLKGSELKVFHKGEERRNASPQNEKELRQYLLNAFGPRAYGVILALAYLGNKTRKNHFTIKLSELCKLIWKKPKGGEKQKVWEAIEALHNAEIRLTQPDRQKGPEATVTYIYSPISVGRFTQSSPDKPPTEVTLSIFSRTGGNAKDGFKNVAIPKAVLKLPVNEFSLAIYLLIESKQGYRANDISASLPELIRAAGLDRTWESNPRQAKQNLKGKLQRMGERGIIGEFLRFDGNQYAVFRANPLRLRAADNQAKLVDSKDD